MIIAALVTFSLLLLAWLVAPGDAIAASMAAPLPAEEAVAETA